MNTTLLTVSKFIFALVLAPMVWSSGVAFYDYLDALPRGYDGYFFWGMFGYLLIYLFFYQFWGVYEFGQKIIAGTLQFMSPVNNFFARAIPFYITVLMLAFYVIKNFLGTDSYDHYFMFFAGFALTMHIVLTAQDTQQEEKVFIKPDYLFIMTFATILVGCVTMLLFNLVLQEWTFPNYIDSVWGGANKVYSLVLQKLGIIG